MFLDEKRSTERHGFLFEHGSDSAIKTYLCPTLAKSIKKNSTPWYRRCKISSVFNNWIWVFLDEKRSTERHGFLFEHGSDSAIPFGMTMEPVS